MSRFAGLVSTESDDDETQGLLAKKKPQYSIKEILGYFRPNVIQQFPLEKPILEAIYVKDMQDPELNTFKPPNEHISDVDASNISKVKSQTQKRVNSRPNEDLSNHWYYMDPVGQILGPYSSKLMKIWFDNRLIDKSLLISQSNSDENGFSSIQTHFPDLSIAFQEIPKAFSINIQKPSSKPNFWRQERTPETLISFSNNEGLENLLEKWEKLDESCFK